MKNIAILGSTGSIGTSTLDVVRRYSDDFRVVALAAGNNVERLAAQIEEFKPEVVSISSPEKRDQLKALLKDSKTDILCSDEGLEAVATCHSAELVVSALVGAAGLKPTFLAIEAGKDIGLANKESLVLGGQLLTALAREKGVMLLPVDSEHSAIFQCLQGNRREDVSSIILTASGGPFREMPADQFKDITVEQALDHPTWQMGPKVTMDSATLMNKGLEVIEAYWLFGFPPEQIEVVIHPQSIIHSMVRYRDGNVINQMSNPDMRLPILYALTYPERWPLDLPQLDFYECGPLTFYKPDYSKFPCLQYAFDALKRSDGAPIVLNRADEVAVAAFLDRRIPFTGIAKLIGTVLKRYQGRQLLSLEDIESVDEWALAAAEDILAEMVKG